MGKIQHLPIHQRQRLPSSITSSCSIFCPLIAKRTIVRMPADEELGAALLQPVFYTRCIPAGVAANVLHANGYLFYCKANSFRKLIADKRRIHIAVHTFHGFVLLQSWNDVWLTKIAGMPYFIA